MSIQEPLHAWRTLQHKEFYHKYFGLVLRNITLKIGLVLKIFWSFKKTDNEKEIFL